MVGNWTSDHSVWRVYDLYNELPKALVVKLQAEFGNIKHVFQIRGGQSGAH